MSCDDNDSIVVIGGGIAGTSCIQALFQDFEPEKSPYKTVILISESCLIKRVNNYVSSGRQLERFDVAEENVKGLSVEAPKGIRFEYIIGTVRYIDHNEKVIVYSSYQDRNVHKKLAYNVLCLCHGSKPRQLNYANRGSDKEIDSRIIVIRDTHTVNELSERMKSCRRLVIVGNGGIGLELINKITDCEKVWIIRDSSIGSAYFDCGAAKFLMDSVIMNENQFCSQSKTESFQSTTINNMNKSYSGSTNFGPALGPNWSQDLRLNGIGCLNKLDIVYDDEVIDVTANNRSGNTEFPVRVFTRSNKQFDCDMIVTAIGVVPNSLEVVGGAESRDGNRPHLEISSLDGGVVVDTQMRTSLDKIYAAGDVVSCERWPNTELWFQMRLWTQARQMGHYAGRCITAHLNRQDPSIYSNFDCFTHCTSFFGYKLVLLGRFNGQQVVDEQFEVIARVEPMKDYVKILVAKVGGRIIGAVLVGDSGLEETIENLIHDQIDVSPFKEQLLDDTVDIEDYFD